MEHRLGARVGARVPQGEHGRPQRPQGGHVRPEVPQEGQSAGGEDGVGQGTQGKIMND